MLDALLHAARTKQLAVGKPLSDKEMASAALGVYKCLSGRGAASSTSRSSAADALRALPLLYCSATLTDTAAQETRRLLRSSSSVSSLRGDIVSAAVRLFALRWSDNDDACAISAGDDNDKENSCGPHGKEHAALRSFVCRLLAHKATCVAHRPSNEVCVCACPQVL